MLSRAVLERGVPMLRMIGECQFEPLEGEGRLPEKVLASMRPLKGPSFIPLRALRAP
jgi:hypothetical protein